MTNFFKHIRILCFLSNSIVKFQNEFVKFNFRFFWCMIFTIKNKNEKYIAYVTWKIWRLLKQSSIFFLFIAWDWFLIFICKFLSPFINILNSVLFNPQIFFLMGFFENPNYRYLNNVGSRQHSGYSELYLKKKESAIILTVYKILYSLCVKLNS